MTLREPVVIPSARPDPDDALELVDVAPLPLVDEDGQPLDWSYREATGLRFERWRAEHGAFAGDRFGLRPEPMPPIVREAGK